MLTKSMSIPASPPPADNPHLNLAADLRAATFRLARRLRAERAVDAMSDGQYTVLATLKVHGPHTLGELAERERVTAPSMNRTVNCLEEAGYVSRTPDAADKRKVNIAATARGSDVVEETVRLRTAWMEGVLSELSDAERATLTAASEIMQRIVTR